jgi:alpha-beta hydrolase superfamily lysophospholipase
LALAVLASLGGVGLAGGVGWLGTGRAGHPARAFNAAALKDFPFAAVTQEVHFPSGDGTPLAGWFVPSRIGAGGTVILLHGYGQSRTAMLPHAAYLHAAGYNVLLLDFRASGRSGGRLVTFGMREPLDVRGAVNYLLQRSDIDPARLAVQGVSLGASIAILAMADDPRLCLAVCESAFTSLNDMIARNFRQYIRLPAFPFAAAITFVMERRAGGSATAVQPEAAVRRLGSRAILLIDAEHDTVNPPDSGPRLRAAASGPAEYWLVADADHAGAFAADPAEYARRVLAFYAQHGQKRPGT